MSLRALFAKQSRLANEIALRHFGRTPKRRRSTEARSAEVRRVAISRSRMKRMQHPERNGVYCAVQSKDAGNQGAFCTRVLRLRHKTPPLRMLDALLS